MSLILSGTDGLSDVDGTAATPAIRGTDANTGIFFPAADTIAFAEGGAEAMRIASTGDVGIGTTSPSAPIDVVSNSSAIGTRIRGRSSDSYGVLEFTNNAASAETARIAADSSNNLIFSNTGSVTERMRIDSSGNVGIGTSSPAGRLDVSQSTAGVARHYLRNTSNSVGAYTILDLVNDSGNNIGEFFCTSSTNTSAFGTNATVLQAATSNPLILGTNGTERMRITSVGEVLMGTTSGANPPSQGIANFGNISNSQIGIGHANGTGGGQYYLVFGYNGGTIGGVTQNGTTAVSYNTTSDYRLKENIAPMTGALARIAALKPCTYTWKSSPDEIGEGFIAHELAQVCPQATTGEKDAVETYIDEDGNEATRPVYQGIDTSFLVATLTAAIQEQQALITALTARITALETP